MNNNRRQRLQSWPVGIEHCRFSYHSRADRGQSKYQYNYKMYKCVSLCIIFMQWQIFFNTFSSNYRYNPSVLHCWKFSWANGRKDYKIKKLSLLFIYLFYFFVIIKQDELAKSHRKLNLYTLTGRFYYIYFDFCCAGLWDIFWKELFLPHNSHALCLITSRESVNISKAQEHIWPTLVILIPTQCTSTCPDIFFFSRTILPSLSCHIRL